MTKYAGNDFRCELFIDGLWYPMDGERSTGAKIVNEQVDTTTKGDTPWRQLNPCGTRSGEINVSGVVRSGEVLAALFDSSFNGTFLQARIFKKLSTQEVVGYGPYLVTNLERNGEYNGAEMYSFTLVSSAPLGYGVLPTVMQINTENLSTGSSASGQFKLPLLSDGVYNFVVSWGDGTSDVITAWNQSAVTHTYPAPGVYTVSVAGQMSKWAFHNTGDRLKVTNLLEWGNTVRAGGIMSASETANDGVWMGCANLVVTAVDRPYFDYEANLHNYFSGCAALPATIPNLAAWKLGTIVNTASFFQGCVNFNDPAVNQWDMSSCLKTDTMFGGSGFNQPLNNWNTSKVKEAGWTFMNQVFNQDIGTLDFSQCYEFYSMFEGNIAFNNGGSDAIKNWNLSSARTFHNMFRGASAFNQPLDPWDVSSCVDFQFMFHTAASFNQPLNSWDLANAAEGPIYRPDGTLYWNSAAGLTGMFQQAVAFNQNLGAWRFPKAKTLNSMFYGATAFNNGGSPDIDTWQTGAITNFSNVFRSATAFNQPVGSWNVALGTNFGEMFYLASAFNQSLAAWDTRSATNLTNMLRGCTAYNQDMNSWNVEKVTSFSSMFYDAVAFKQPLGNWWPKAATTGGLSNIFTNANLNVGAVPTQLMPSNLDINAWTRNQLTYNGVTGSGANVNPDGTTGIRNGVPTNVSSNDHSATRVSATEVGKSYRAVVVVKPKDTAPYNFAQWTASGAFAGDIIADLTTGTILSNTPNASITALGNGWYALVITSVAADVALTTKLKVWDTSVNALGNIAYVGNNVNGMSVWLGSVIEDGADLSNYGKTLAGWVGWAGLCTPTVSGGLARQGITGVLGIVSGGTGYVIGDVLTVAGGTLFPGAPAAQINVTNVDVAGAITAVTVRRGSGNYTDTTGTSVTGGSGAGAVLTLSWGFKGASLPTSMAPSTPAALDVLDAPALAAKRYLITTIADGGRQWTISDGGYR